MRDERPRPRSLESLRKEAKRWHAALHDGDADAHVRLQRVVPDALATPALRDVQHALAREHGFDGWTALTAAVGADAEAGVQLLGWYEAAADALLEAYRTGTPEAMERHYEHTWHRRPWRGMRTYVQLDVGKRPADPDDEVDITLDEARWLVAAEHGFASWEALRGAARHTTGRALLAPKPARIVDDHALELMAGDAGITALDLTGTAVTDRGLAVLRQLPALQSISLAGTRVTDAGVAHLSHCRELRSVDLSGTRTGDGALRALAGMEHLHHLRSGALVTDEGLSLLHKLPVFKVWRGGEARFALTSYDASPNQLVLRGSFTDRGMAHLRGLDGLFGLNVDDAALRLTAAALVPLVDLPHLGHLAVDAKDDWMPLIAAMPRLRFLGAQDTVAGDDGFVALSRSQSIEYIWGRRCHNLGNRGFAALGEMPALRGLSVSCRNVDDAGLAALPRFPALRELMPMDVPDAGYVHVGACERLEELVLMYCRDTTDAATEHITRLSRLSYYFNSYTTITDRTPALLAGMDSLERVTFDSCHSLTNAGVAALARLPRLRELRVSGRGLTKDVATAFGPGVQVHSSP